MKNAAERTCNYCGAVLSGRSDKKFCNDQCRANYNNQNKKPYERLIADTNSKLRRNRTILQRLAPEGKATVRKSKLVQLGFDFRYCTSFFGKAGKVYLYCFDYGYLPIHERSLTDGKKTAKVLIVQKQDFTENADPWKIQDEKFQNYQSATNNRPQ